MPAQLARRSGNSTSAQSALKKADSLHTQRRMTGSMMSSTMTGSTLSAAPRRRFSQLGSSASGYVSFPSLVGENESDSSAKPKEEKKAEKEETAAPKVDEIPVAVSTAVSEEVVQPAVVEEPVPEPVQKAVQKPATPVQAFSVLPGTPIKRTDSVRSKKTSRLWSCFG